MLPQTVPCLTREFVHPDSHNQAVLVSLREQVVQCHSFCPCFSCLGLGLLANCHASSHHSRVEKTPIGHVYNKVVCCSATAAKGTGQWVAAHTVISCVLGHKEETKEIILVGVAQEKGRERVELVYKMRLSHRRPRWWSWYSQIKRQKKIKKTLLSDHVPVQHISHQSPGVDHRIVLFQRDGIFDRHFDATVRWLFGCQDQFLTR